RPLVYPPHWRGSATNTSVGFETCSALPYNYSLSKAPTPLTSDRYFGLIPAAGVGERFHGAHGANAVMGANGGNTVPKQYQEIAGRPMLAHAIDALLAVPEIDIVFVV